MNTWIKILVLLAGAWTGAAGQQIFPVGITVTPFAMTLDEGSSAQMTARLVYNTGGSAPIEPSRVQWWVGGGQPATISNTGLFTAGKVPKDTQIIFYVSYQGFTNNIPLFIRDSVKDNYGSYAGDGMDDEWQVQEFGIGHPQAGPLADPDGDGQNNRFEYTAGTRPLDRHSRLVFAVLRVPSQPTHRKIEINPILAGRTYQLQYSTDLTAASWKPIPATPVDTGGYWHITDTAAGTASRFYRVHVTKP